MTKTSAIIPVERVESLILWFRGQKVIIDSDLATLYRVSTKRLNEQVKRNIRRFPSDFMFQLTEKEKEQVVANCDHLQNLKFSPSLPYAFTEHGAIMVASILNTKRAVAMSVYVVRAFIKLRQMLAPYKELMQKLRQIERKLQAHDEQIADLNAIRKLMSSIEESPKEPIGFLTEAKAHKTRVKKAKAKKKKISSKKSTK